MNEPDDLTVTDSDRARDLRRDLRRDYERSAWGDFDRPTRFDGG